MEINEIENQLSKMHRFNNTYVVDKYTVFYSVANLGQFVQFHEGKYFDILGDDGIEGEYMTKAEVLEFLKQKLNL